MPEIKKIITYFETRPLMFAAVIFMVLFLYFQVIKKGTASTAPKTTTLAPGTYIDPVTGAITALPNTSEQYIQSYNSYPTGGTTVIQQNAPVTKPPIIVFPVQKPPPSKQPPTSKQPQPQPKPKPKPQPQPVAHYITVKPWPDQLSTLSGIASYAGTTLAKVESLNPQYKSNWNLIHPGQQVRVA